MVQKRPTTAADGSDQASKKQKLVHIVDIPKKANGNVQAKAAQKKDGNTNGNGSAKAAQKKGGNTNGNGPTKVAQKKDGNTNGNGSTKVAQKEDGKEDSMPSKSEKDRKGKKKQQVKDKLLASGIVLGDKQNGAPATKGDWWSAMKPKEKKAKATKEEKDQPAPFQYSKVFVNQSAWKSVVMRQGVKKADHFYDYDLQTLPAIDKNFKFKELRPVQKLSFPILFKGQNLIAQSKTGSGKTIAFLVPVIENMLLNGGNAVVLAPTRELVFQIQEEAEKLLENHKDIVVDVCMGGTNQNTENQRFRTQPPRLLIASPGRLFNHLEEGSLPSAWANLVRYLVMDEVDRLMEMGFQRHISGIRDRLINVKQTMLFSATITDKVVELGRVEKTCPRISTMSEIGEVNKECKQQYIHGTNKDFMGILHTLLVQHKGDKILVFFPTVKVTKYFTELYNAMGFTIGALHSGKSTKSRQDEFKTFRRGAGAILFATGVAARGLDVSDIDVIIQWGTPLDLEDYIHRIGRTSRNGREGKSILFVRKIDLSILSQLKEKKIILEEIQQPAKYKGEFPDHKMTPNAKKVFCTYAGFYRGRSGKETITDFLDFAEMLGLSDVRFTRFGSLTMPRDWLPAAIQYYAQRTGKTIAQAGDPSTYNDNAAARSVPNPQKNKSSITIVYK